MADAEGTRATRGQDRSDELLLTGIARAAADGALLPTPSAGNFNEGEDLDSWEARRQANLAKGINGNGQGTPLAIAAQQLLRTPTAQLAENGGSQHPDKRKAGGHGPTLADEVEHLLPTPTARLGDDTSRGADPARYKGPQSLNGRRSNLDDCIAAVETQAPWLLPTPRVAATRTSRTAATRQDSRSAPSLDQAIELAAGILPRELESLEEVPASWRGGRTSPQSAAGNGSSAGRRHVQLSLDELEKDFLRDS